MDKETESPGRIDTHKEHNITHNLDCKFSWRKETAELTALNITEKKGGNNSNL